MVTKRKYPNFLSPREEEILTALGKFNENKNVAHQKIHVAKTGTHMTAGGVRSHMTRIFKRYLEAQHLVTEYYDVFQNRLTKHNAVIKKQQRQLNKRKKEAR